MTKYQAQIKVLSKVAKKKGVQEASSDLYADNEEIVDQYKGSAKNERTTPELYADKEEIIDHGTYEDTEIDLTEESFGYDDFETSMEGTTYDSIKIGMSKDKKDADKLFKSAKKNCKDGKYSDAIKDIEKAKSIYNKLEKELSKLDDDMAGTVCSSILTGFPLSEIYAICSGVGQSSMHKKNIVSYVLGAVASTVGNAVGGVGAGSMLGRAARIGAQVIDSKSGEPKNPTKAKTIECMREAVKQCDAIIAEIKKAKKGVKESAGLYADNEEINDQYKSSFNNTRTSKDLYADDEEIKDVGIYEEDELNLTDLDDDIEASCKEKCGSANEVSFRPSAKDDKMLKLKGEVIALEDKIADGKRKGMAEDELKKYHDELSDKKYELNTMLIDSHAGDGRRAAMAGSDTDLSESSDMYADNQEINDRYKSSPNIQRTGNNNYADDQEIKDVGVYEDEDEDLSDDLDLTDMDDDIECGNNCGSALEVKGDAEANTEKREYYEKRTGEHSINAKHAGNMDYSKSDAISKKPMTTAQDYHDRVEAAQRTKKYYGSLNEETKLDLTAEEAFELELLEANLYADDEPVEDKYKTSPSGKIEHEDYYADNQEIKDVGVYESDNKDETAEVDEADPGEDLAEESLLDLLDI